MSKDILVYDARTFEQVDRIVVGDYTDDVIGSPDGRRAYGNAQIWGGNPVAWNANDAGKVFAMDTRDNSMLWSTFVDGSPHHLAVSPDGRRVYVPLFDRHYLLVLDAETGKIIDRWHALIGNHSLEVSKDGSRLYAGSIITDAILVFDTRDGTILQMIETIDGVRPIQIDEPSRRIYLQRSRFHGFEVRNLDTGALIQEIELPTPEGGIEVPAAFPHTVNHGLAISPDRKYLLAAASLSGYVAVYRLHDLGLVAQISVGEDPNWIRMRADSKVAFVSNRGSDDLSILDLEQMKEVARVPAGDMPQRLSVIRTTPAER